VQPRMAPQIPRMDRSDAWDSSKGVGILREVALRLAAAIETRSEAVCEERLAILTWPPVEEPPVRGPAVPWLLPGPASRRSLGRPPLRHGSPWCPPRSCDYMFSFYLLSPAGKPQTLS